MTEVYTTQPTVLTPIQAVHKRQQPEELSSSPELSTKKQRAVSGSGQLPPPPAVDLTAGMAAAANPPIL